MGNTKTMKVKLPVIYSQLDPKWAKALLGFNTDPEYNFYNYACLISSFAAVASYYGIKETPVTINEKFKQAGAYVNGGEYINGKFGEIYPDINELITPTPSELTDQQMGEIKGALDKGYPVILGIDYNPQTLKFDSHFVVAVGYSETDENDIMIADSLGGRIHSLKDYLDRNVTSARRSIYKYFIMEGRVPQVVQTASNPITPPVAVSALPSNYNQIVHGSTQWGELVKAELGDVAPETVFYSREDLSTDIKRIIAGKTRVEIKEVEKSVNTPNLETVTESNFAQNTIIVGQNEKWDQTVSYLELGKSPDESSFEDVKRVVAGIKSRTTDFENKAKEATKLNAAKDVTINNLNDQISTLKKEMLQKEKLNKAQVDSLKRAAPSFESLARQYETVIKEVRADLTKQLEETQQLRVDVAVKKVENGTETPHVASRRTFISLPVVIDLLKKFVRLN